jgi:hypothetical protein
MREGIDAWNRDDRDERLAVFAPEAAAVVYPVRDGKISGGREYSDRATAGAGR